MTPFCCSYPNNSRTKLNENWPSLRAQAIHWPLGADAAPIAPHLFFQRHDRLIASTFHGQLNEFALVIQDDHNQVIGHLLTKGIIADCKKVFLIRVKSHPDDTQFIQ